jgi:hypothetical protein
MGEAQQIPAMEEIQENWQQGARHSQPDGTSTPSESTSSATNLVITPSSTDSGILPNGDQLRNTAWGLSQSPASRSRPLADLIATSIPDPDNRTAPSHPRCAKITSGPGRPDHVPNPAGQAAWVDALVSESVAELYRLLKESRRQRRRELRLEQQLRERQPQVEVLLDAQRHRRARRRGDGDEGDPQQQQEDEEREVERLQLQLLGAEINRPWTCRCACLDENGKEKEDEGYCVPWS